MSALDVALVDYGAGNLRSVGKALERSGFAVRVTGDPAGVRGADCVVLPGVGAFADAMASLRAKRLDAAVRESVERRTPFLGLCFGLQLLYEEGEEHGVTKGLGLLRGRVERFPARAEDGSTLKVPHIGWNEVRFDGAHPMVARLPAKDTYYFVHSYRAVPADSDTIVGRCDYGSSFVAAVAQDRVFAVQFHPEKSQSAGRRLLDAYRGWVEDER